jgi:transposase
MCKVVKIEITESVEELHQLLRQQKTGSSKEKIQALYLLKSKQVKTVKKLAEISGRSRITVQRWLKLYREGGLSSLLEQKKSPGRPKVIPEESREKLKQELADPQGFKSYEEVRTWLRAVEGIEVSYKVVHDTVHYKMKAKLKVPRPVNIKKEEKAEEEFKKKLSKYLELIQKYLIEAKDKTKKIRYWCGDESRLGLKTVEGRAITLKGVKPVGTTQFKRENFYLYGLVEPLTGESFIWEISHLNTECFQKFLEKFAAKYPEEIHVIQLDNGAFHLSNSLQVPENIILLFQPAYTPEVNPIERLWKEIKKNLSWECFENLDELREAVWKQIQKLDESIVFSVTGWGYILDALFVSGFS